MGGTIHKERIDIITRVGGGAGQKGANLSERTDILNLYPVHGIDHT